MAFIAGYVAERPEPTERILERVRTFSVLPGESSADYEDAVVKTRFGHLIVKHKTRYPVSPQITSEADGNVLAMLGFLIPRTSIDVLVEPTARTAAQTLEEREGEFVAVFADGATGTVHIVNDRFSSRPFYVLRRDGSVYFSSNVAFLLTLARETYHPDVVGWLEACTTGHTLGSRTTVEGVERLRPAVHLTITPERTCERRYWCLHHQPDPGLDPAAHSAEVFATFRSSVERRARLTGKGVVGLSGGLDSRLVAAALPTDVEFSAFTFLDVPGASSTPQTRAAAEVCAVLGIPHHIARLPTGFAKPSEVLALTGGMRAYQHMAIVMAYVEEMRRVGTNFLLGGGPGDSLAGAFVPSSLYVDPARLHECIEDAQRQRLALSRHWPLVFRDEVIDANRRTVEDELAESFASVTGPTAAHRVTAWAMRYRQPAFTFTSLLHTHPDVTEGASHLGYRYSDLMLQLPATWLHQRSFYSYMIYNALPQLRHVPYANTGALLSGRTPTVEVAPASMVRREVGRILSYGTRAARRLARPILGREAPGVSSLMFGDRALLDHVAECVHSVPQLRAIVDPRRCDALLEQTRKGACPSEEVLGNLTAMCVSATTLERKETKRRLATIIATAFQATVETFQATLETMPNVWNLWSAFA